MDFPQWIRQQRAIARRAEKRRSIQNRRRRHRNRNPNSTQVPLIHPYERNRHDALPTAKTKLVCPATLDFVTDPQSACLFFRRLRHLVTSGKFGEVLVDHSGLVDVSPAGALVLMAELYLGKFLRPKINLLCKFPMHERTLDLLGEIGYFEYFPAVRWNRSAEGDRFFLQHCHGSGVNEDAARQLVNHLKFTGALPSARLYEALVEGMSNASEWGYDNRTGGYRSWWLLGYTDKRTGEMAYCFYDQGAGIPVTIRTRLKDRVLMIRPRGSQLIRKAVVSGHYSRTGKVSRGRGLPTLKRFVDEAATGELMIFSRQSRVIFRTAQNPLLDDFDMRLQGTLISWNFTGHGNQGN